MCRQNHAGPMKILSYDCRPLRSTSTNAHYKRLKGHVAESTIDERACSPNRPSRPLCPICPVRPVPLASVHVPYVRIIVVGNFEDVFSSAAFCVAEGVSVYSVADVLNSSRGEVPASAFLDRINMISRFLSWRFELQRVPFALLWWT